jgi:uracil-DNA glycosylase
MLKEAISNLKEAAKNHALYENVLKTDGNIVIFRGNLSEPDYLFIGEAPGNNENKEGIPFIGRSGKLLNSWLESLEIDSFAVINTVPIIPLDVSGKIRKPTKEEISYFKPHVDFFISQIKPKNIICLGKSALEYMDIGLENTSWKDRIGFIYHPSYYLRRGQNGLDDFRKLIENKLKKPQKNLDEF